MSALGAPSRNQNSAQHNRAASSSATLNKAPSRYETPSPDTESPILEFSPTGTARAEPHGQRPESTTFSHDPPFMKVAEDTPAELQPIFTFLNSHTNKLYHEGYFLKLNDLDTHGRPCTDRQWVECYAQLVGTVLSLWDANALDAAGGDADVPPTFINLADASIRMIETLPTRNQGMQPLKNILSVSSAGQNRYLLHFNSFHSLTQWTAAIRLAMFEHTSLYEAYTGSIIAGKGKNLNNIKAILERCRFKQEDWARVRFGAGTPWRRCWFVISPPDEKEVQKLQKTMKKKSAYDRAPRLLTGNIKFYETKKTKKTKPIATITNAYSAYAIYPQSKALIDQSTLIKIEGQVTVHSRPESTSEGFVFVMPEVHPAVSGFEMMLRFLIPTFDVFNLYGRPTRLLAATNHIKSIMFAFPKRRRYGYLDVMDIVSLMQTPGSHTWNEAEWRKQLKEATMRRMSTASSRTSSVSSKPRFRSSLPNRYSAVRGGPAQRYAAAENRSDSNQSLDDTIPEARGDEAAASIPYSRGSDETGGLSAHDLQTQERERAEATGSSSDTVWKQHEDTSLEPVDEHLRGRSPSPVVSPPAFTHAPGEMPAVRPQPSSDLRNANNRMSNATLSQLVAAGRINLNDQNSKDSYSSESPKLETIADHQNVTNEGPAPPVHDNRASVISTIGPLNGDRLSLDTTKAVKRKPAPMLINRQTGAATPMGEPSYDDLRHTIDEDVLNQIGSQEALSYSPGKHRQQDEESVYDDVSTTSPDYASTHGSIYSKPSVKSVTKPRMGVKKTVGTAPPPKEMVIGDAHYTLGQQTPQQNPDIPAVDFGPTLTYLPTTGRPNTSETLKNPGHQRTDSNATERQRFSVPTHPMDRPHSRSPSQDEYRRSMRWQPGMAAGRPTTPGGLTPDQYVQQRAAPSPSNYVHHRASSTTPPPQRPLSGDWMAHSRSNSNMPGSRDAQPRPHSRGANSMMSFNDVSSHLSAREQEHVARMTGSSFFNLSSDTSKQQAPVNPMGLVGAIDAREREKKGIKDGMSNQMVQHAIAQRQYHQQQQPTPAYGAQNGGYSSVYNMPAGNQAWDGLNQPYRADEPRRKSWYGQFQAQPQTPSGYQQNQYFSQHPGYVGNVNTMHS
ncbi:hypothetical protein MW887_010194 [Aspergillus wentii]|nr:hypothetical protein MW887_010194 [Aspergillus wentii]